MSRALYFFFVVFFSLVYSMIVRRQDENIAQLHLLLSQDKDNERMYEGQEETKYYYIYLLNFTNRGKLIKVFVLKE
jgi:hypothetical protein